MGAAIALTGWRLTGREMYACRLATHFVPSHMIEDMLNALGAMGPAAAGTHRSRIPDPGSRLTSLHFSHFTPLV